MVELLIVGGLICLLVIVTGTFIALQMQRRMLRRIHTEQDAWQHAQEGHQFQWQAGQRKQALDTERKLAAQVQEVRGEWKNWENKAEQRIGAMDQQFQTFTRRASLEQELARLPHVDDTPLPLNAAGQRPLPADWRPPVFYKADLSGQDFSHRYFGRADLREARLANANLYMADLSGASLVSADLRGVNLSGANLAGADLRGANLADANLLVADLHNAVLHGANLLTARNLTPGQLRTAIYDNTTLVDEAVDITLPRIPSVRPTPAAASISAISVESEPTELSEFEEPGQFAVIEVHEYAGAMEPAVSEPEASEELSDDASPVEPEPAILETEPLAEPVPQAEEMVEEMETTLKSPAIALFPEPEFEQHRENEADSTSEIDTLAVEREIMPSPSSAAGDEEAEETIRQPAADHEEKVPLLLPLPPHSGRNGSKGTGSPAGKQGNIHTGKFGATASRKKYAGKRQARAN